jgi:hypothetical protein
MQLQQDTKMTYVAHHNLLTRLAFSIGGGGTTTTTTTGAATPKSGATTIVSPTTAAISSPRLVRTIVVGVQFLVRKISATTRL